MFSAYNFKNYHAEKSHQHGSEHPLPQSRRAARLPRLLSVPAAVTAASGPAACKTEADCLMVRRLEAQGELSASWSVQRRSLPRPLQLTEVAVDPWLPLASRPFTPCLCLRLASPVCLSQRPSPCAGDGVCHDLSSPRTTTEGCPPRCGAGRAMGMGPGAPRLRPDPGSGPSRAQLLADSSPRAASVRPRGPGAPAPQPGPLLVCVSDAP